MGDNSKKKQYSKDLILAIDDDSGILELLKMVLESSGYDFISANRGYHGIKLAQEKSPKLILLDVMMPEMDGHVVCRKLRENISTRDIPVIFLSARSSTSDIVNGLDIGADGYLEKPFTHDELLARIKSVLERKETYINTNPLTKLPGTVQQELEKRIAAGEKFSACYADLDNFKSFNDKYGFVAGDNVIRMAARTFSEVNKKYGTENDFVGHIGGDDFMFITTPEKDIELCKRIIERFDKEVILFYNPEDLEKGYIEARDRQGVLVKHPIISMSIVIISNEQREITHLGQISTIEGELKAKVKKMPGSNFYKDGRIDEDSASFYYERPTVLLANKDARELWRIKHIIDSETFLQTTVIESGSGVIEALTNNKPDFLLLNEELKFISPYQVFMILRSEPDFAELPVVFLTENENDLPKNIKNRDNVYWIKKGLSKEIFIKELKKITDKLGLNAEEDSP